MSAVRTYENSERPDGWRLVRLGELVGMNQGGTPRKEDPEYWDGSIPFLTGADLTDFRVGRQHARSFLTDAGLVSGHTTVCEAGTLLLATRTRVGLAGIATELMGASQDITCLYPNEQIDSEFLCRTLLRLAPALQRLSRGTTIQGITREDVCSVPVLIPPLSEQRAIADVLDSIDETIERTEAVIVATETLRDSLLHDLLTRGVPGWHTEWKDVPGIGTIPASWEVVRLGDGVVHVGSGVTPRGGKSAYTASGITFLRSQNVHFDGLRLEDVVYIPPEIDHAMTRSRVRPDDVLLNITGASIGRCTVVPSDFGPANVNQHVCIVRTSEELNPHFVWKWLITPRSQTEIDDIQTGQSRQGLNYQQVRQLTIARPPSAEQDAIVGILSRVDLTIAETKRERDGLRLLKDSTADALLTGRARIHG